MAVLPAVLLVYYYKQDKNRPAPKGLIVNVFLLGIFSALSVSLLANLVGQANAIFKWSSFFYSIGK
jgi:RsiW-degrading membrane proteinase PrsW (M82 family)